MAANNNTRPGAFALPWGSGSVSVVSEEHSVERLLSGAKNLRLSAPEVALVLAERAASLAESAGLSRLWTEAEGLAVSAKVRLGQRAPTVAQAVTALRTAEDAGQSKVAAQLRIDLATCARSIGSPLSGLSAIRLVVAEAELPPVVRAAALVELASCLAQFGQTAELDRVLAQAESLCDNDRVSNQDERIVLRSLVHVAISAYRRRHADLTGAAEAARSGLDLLERLSTPGIDGEQAKVRLVLHLVCAMVDRGDVEAARKIAEPLLRMPVRAACVAPLGWLRLAIATRVLLPAGSADAAMLLIREALHDGERYDLPALSARLWMELATIQEQLGDPTEALECFRRARSAEHHYTRQRRQANALLISEFGAGDQIPSELDRLITASLTAARSDSRSLDNGSRNASSEPNSTSTEAYRVDRVHRDSRNNRTPHRSAQPDFSLDTAFVGAAALEAEISPRQALAAAAARAEESHQWAFVPSQDEPRGASSEPRKAASSTFSAEKPVIPEPTTRHDSEHGSIAARSVLDRLGIDTGGAGGRRRATEGSDPHKDSPLAELPSFRLPTSLPKPPPKSESFPAVENEWLPRLRLPPSLASISGIDDSPVFDSSPFDAQFDSSFGAEPFAADVFSSSEAWNSVASNVESTSDYRSDFGEPFGPGYDQAISSEEPAADAGLADLLARALAEHRAGTASAAALVKSIGERQSVFGGPRSLQTEHNGRGNGHRVAEARTNGRHRGD